MWARAALTIDKQFVGAICDGPHAPLQTRDTFPRLFLRCVLVTEGAVYFVCLRGGDCGDCHPLRRCCDDATTSSSGDVVQHTLDWKINEARRRNNKRRRQSRHGRTLIRIQLYGAIHTNTHARARAREHKQRIVKHALCATIGLQMLWPPPHQPTHHHTSGVLFGLRFSFFCWLPLARSLSGRTDTGPVVVVGGVGVRVFGARADNADAAADVRQLLPPLLPPPPPAVVMRVVCAHANVIFLSASSWLAISPPPAPATRMGKSLTHRARIIDARGVWRGNNAPGGGSKNCVGPGSAH